LSPKVEHRSEAGSSGAGKRYADGNVLITYFLSSSFYFLFFIFCPFQDIFQRKRRSSFSPTEQLKAEAFGDLGGVIGGRFYNQTYGSRRKSMGCHTLLEKEDFRGHRKF